MDQENARGQMDDGQARAFIAELLSGDVKEISINETGGWDIELEHIREAAVSLLPDNDGDFSYCHIETIHEDDKAYYREVVMHTRSPSDGHPGIILEGAYQRRIGIEPEDPDADFEGTLVLVEGDAWDAWIKRMRRRFAERALKETLVTLEYQMYTLRTVSFYMDEAPASDQASGLAQVTGRINREVAGILAKAGAQHA